MDQAGDSSEAALDVAVRAAQAGHQVGFRHPYRAVQPGLLRYLSVLVGADAEDVASETWAQVCRDLPPFESDGDGFGGRRWTGSAIYLLTRPRRYCSGW